MDNKSRHHAGHEAPTANWVVGRDAFGTQQYVLHTGAPGFFAKISDDEDGGALSSFSYAMTDGRSLYDFVWLDDPPAGNSLRDVLRQADAAILRAASK